MDLDCRMAEGINQINCSMQTMDKDFQKLNDGLDNILDGMTIRGGLCNKIIYQSKPAYLSYVDTTIHGNGLNLTVRYKERVETLYESLFPNDPIQKWSEEQCRKIDEKYRFIEDLEKAICVPSFTPTFNEQEANYIYTESVITNPAKYVKTQRLSTKVER